MTTPTLQDAARAELIEALSEARQPYGRPGTRDVEVTEWNQRIDRALAALAASEATAGVPVAHTSERHFALREAHGHADEEAYFKARPRLDGPDERAAFRAGHQRGFDAAEKVYTHPPAPQQPAPTRSQQLAEAGFTARDRRLTCDECGAKVSAQMLPIHRCEQPAPDTVAVPRALFDAWRGMCFGVDWNRGTHAKHHRGTVERLMRELATIPGEPSTFAQPAPAERGEQQGQARDTDLWINVRALRLRLDEGDRHTPYAYRTMQAADDVRITFRELPGEQAAQGAADVARGLSPTETVLYWRNAYADPASGPHFSGHGMVVHLLTEYLQLRAALSAAPRVPAAAMKVRTEMGADSDAADAARMRWLLAGNGYFMWENFLCGHAPPTPEEQDAARAKIDAAMRGEL